MYQPLSLVRLQQPGGGHRAELINEDDAGGLAALNAHTKAFGYSVEDDDDVWDRVVEAIMSLF
jgi:hypothetical protein